MFLGFFSWVLFSISVNNIHLICFFLCNLKTCFWIKIGRKVSEDHQENLIELLDLIENKYILETRIEVSTWIPCSVSRKYESSERRYSSKGLWLVNVRISRKLDSAQSFAKQGYKTVLIEIMGVPGKYNFI
jgi:hypothetical protein